MKQAFANSLKRINSLFARGANKTLNGVEWIGNKFPKPFYLFLYATILIIFLSLILHYAIPNGLVLEGINNNEPIMFFNLIGRDGIIWWLKNFITNFTHFATIGIVIITTIFVNIAEKSGFIDVVMRKIAVSIPKKALTPIIIFIGCLTNLASDAGYLILIPLAGLLYHRAGRHPLVGIAAVFAGVSGGFATALVPGSVDILMTTFTNDILAKQGLEHLSLNPMSIYFLTLTLLFVYTFVGWILTDFVIEKRLIKRYKVAKQVGVKEDPKVKLSKLERRGMWATLVFILLYFLGIILMLVIPGAPFSPMIYGHKITPTGGGGIN